MGREKEEKTKVEGRASDQSVRAIDDIPCIAAVFQ